MSDTSTPDNSEWLDERTCKKCGVTKPLTDFQKSTQCTSGYRYRCKTCVNLLVRRVYDKAPDVKLAKNAVYRKNNWERVKQVAYAHRDRYKAKGNQAVNNAIAAGKFARQPCDTRGKTKADFHHTDGYEPDKWFVGRWMCRQHHLALHKELRWKMN